LYYGNQYFLFVYREYTDIRLVGAPPSSIGKFGGETDNWTWPRHTGDFSIFRIYADKDNNPANYSKDNVPYQPKKYFKISTAGVKEGDFTFIYGFPGQTQEYIHSEGVRYISEISDPSKVALRTLRLDIFNKYMSQSQAVRIQYSTKKARVANAWKKWQGESQGIRKMKTVETNRKYEKNFIEWAKGSEYEGIVEKIDSLYNMLEMHHFIVDVFSETVQTVEIARLSAQVSGKEKDALRYMLESFYKDYYLPIDKECFAAVMEEFGKLIPAEYQPDYYKEQIQKYGNAAAWAEEFFAESVFADQKKMEQVQSDLRRYQAELADVAQTAAFDLQPDGFLQFADFFWDNIFSDLAVRDHIYQSQGQMQTLREQVQQIQTNLERELDETERGLKALREEKSELIRNA
jgi:hypothetical protein